MACAASIPVVGFNAILMSEHFGAFFAFGVLHAALCIQWIKGLLPAHSYQTAKKLLLLLTVAAAGIVSVLVVGYVMTSPTFGWTGVFIELTFFIVKDCGRRVWQVPLQLV